MILHDFTIPIYAHYMLHAWNLYQDLPKIQPVFVGKYTSTMEHLGYVTHQIPTKYLSWNYPMILPEMIKDCKSRLGASQMGYP